MRAAPRHGMYETLWRDLLDWYAAHKRSLPWRTTRDTYAILISEAMRQQTEVERVIPKYEAFLARLPALAELAGAAPADVIRLWSGLGYNRRAVWLQQAAQQSLARWGGLPSDVADLMSLPGIGPYTARAVACFAFDAQVAVLDTNVRRVLARLLLGASVAPPLSEKQMQAMAEAVLPPGRAYDWNQALMDLGATICTHQAPLCLICPVQSSCRAFPFTAKAPESGSASVAEAKPRWKETPFAGSRRYYRGRVVALLRGLAAGETMTLAALGQGVKANYSGADEAWLRDLVADLAKDGLVDVGANGTVSLPH